MSSQQPAARYLCASKTGGERDPRLNDIRRVGQVPTRYGRRPRSAIAIHLQDCVTPQKIL
eukprot:scaffold188443_cov17-Prasinocladus_malaysianus.AAC.1